MERASVTTVDQLQPKDRILINNSIEDQIKAIKGVSGRTPKDGNRLKLIDLTSGRALLLRQRDAVRRFPQPNTESP